MFCDYEGRDFPADEFVDVSAIGMVHHVKPLHTPGGSLVPPDLRPEIEQQLRITLQGPLLGLDKDGSTFPRVEMGAGFDKRVRDLTITGTPPERDE